MKVLLIVIFLFLSLTELTTVFGQSLTKDTIRLRAYNTRGEEIYNTNLDSSFIYWTQAYHLADSIIKLNLGADIDIFAKRYKGHSLNNLGYYYKSNGNHKESLNYYNKALEIWRNGGDSVELAITFNNIGFVYKKKGFLDSTIFFYKKALQIREIIKDTLGLSTSYNNIGNVLNRQGLTGPALEFHFKALSIRQDLNDSSAIAQSYNNIGFVYLYLKDTTAGLDYYRRALKLKRAVGHQKGISLSLNNIGWIYLETGVPEQAIKYLEEGLAIAININYKKHIATIKNNLGAAYLKLGDKKKAKELYLGALEIRKEINDIAGIQVSYLNLGRFELLEGNIVLADKYGNQAMEIAQKLGYPTKIRDCAKHLFKLYDKKGNSKKALEYHKLYIQMRDSVNSNENHKAAAKQLARVHYEKILIADSIRYLHAQDILDAKILAQDAELSEKEAKERLSTIMMTGLSLMVLLVLIFVFVINRRLKITRKQKLTIQEQKNEVEKQKDIIEETHKEITDSINYARRIQTAILPTSKLVKKHLTDSFILYLPKDVVAGDFYWVEPLNNKVLFAAADCTGHGVPGAMVSVVCNNALNRSVREFGLNNPGEILGKTRELVIEEFEKSEEDVKDGMDIALCSLSTLRDSQGTYELQYAGAHNPLWIIRKDAKQIEEVKANKQPIGKFEGQIPYENHTIQLNRGDSFYVFSDGYPDQFGGTRGKKYKSRKLKEFLLSIQEKSMKEQKSIMLKEFETWKGDIEQIDDVCFIGVRI